MDFTEWKDFYMENRPIEPYSEATMQSNGHVLLIMQKISCKKLLKLVKNMKGQCGNNKVNV